MKNNNNTVWSCIDVWQLCHVKERAFPRNVPLPHYWMMKSHVVSYFPQLKIRARTLNMENKPGKVNTSVHIIVVCADVVSFISFFSSYAGRVRVRWCMFIFSFTVMTCTALPSHCTLSYSISSF